MLFFWQGLRTLVPLYFLSITGDRASANKMPNESIHSQDTEPVVHVAPSMLTRWMIWVPVPTPLGVDETITVKAWPDWSGSNFPCTRVRRACSCVTPNRIKTEFSSSFLLSLSLQDAKLRYPRAPLQFRYLLWQLRLTSFLRKCYLF